MSEYKDYGFPDKHPSHTFYYLHNELLAMLDKDKNTCILDLGCGNGYLVNYLLSNGFNAYGTDASADGITIARQSYPDRFFLQDLSTDKLPADLQTIAFNTIISTEVIEHLYAPEAFIDFCKMILPANGEIIISTPYHGYLKNLMLSLFNKWDTHMSPLWPGGHIKLWSKATISKLLTKNGFRIVSFVGCGRWPYLWKSMIIKAKLD